MPGMSRDLLLPRARRGGHVAARRMRGQASVLVVIVAAILVIAALLVYDSGRMVITRVHLQNAADSAAYSGAVELARAYNFAAYSNRAMVADQVAIAQMVGLTSWARYYCLIYTTSKCGPFSTLGTADEIKTVLELFSPAQPGTATMSAYRAISKALFTGINKGAGLIVTVLNTVEQTLSLASRTYYGLAYADLALSEAPYNSVDPGIMWRTLRATDPNAQIANASLGDSVGAAGAVATGAWLAQTLRFTKTYNPTGASSTSDPGNRFHNVVMNSRDAFDSGRSSAEVLPFDTLISAFGDCFGDGFGGIDVFSLGYSGSTTLSTDNKTWTTKNGSNPQGDFSAFLAAGVCVINVPTPVGDIPVPIPLVIPISPSMSWANVTAGQKTANYTLSGSHYSGLQKYLDVRNLKKADYTAPAITLVAVRKQGTIATTQQLNQGTQGTNARTLPIAGGNLALTDGEGKQLMAVTASAQVYFVRPVYQTLPGHHYVEVPDQENTLGGHTLYASLFSPYWEAHLVPTPVAAKNGAVLSEFLP